jgi:hypothetical protein
MLSYAERTPFLEELARRFDRSVIWVPRRLAMVERLPGAALPAGLRWRDDFSAAHECTPIQLSQHADHDHAPSAAAMRWCRTTKGVSAPAWC